MTLLTESQQRAYDNLHTLVHTQQRTPKTSYLDLFGRAIVIEICDFLIEPESSIVVNTHVLKKWSQDPLLVKLFCQCHTVTVNSNCWLKRLKNYPYFTSLKLNFSGLYNSFELKHIRELNCKIIVNNEMLEKLQQFPNLEILHINIIKIHNDINVQLPLIKKLSISINHEIYIHPLLTNRITFDTLYTIFPNIIEFGIDREYSDGYFGNKVYCDNIQDLLQFQHLKKLEILDNQFQNYDLNQLTNLTDLNIKFLEYGILLSDNIHISNLVNLTRLEGLVTNTIELQHCTKLKHLNLDTVSKFENLDILSTLQQLTFLSFKGFNQHVQYLTNLEYLKMTINRDYIIDLQRLTKLKYLHINGKNDLNLINVDNLRELSFNYIDNTFCKTCNFKQIINATKLQKLTISSRMIGINTLHYVTQLSNLQELTLIGDFYNIEQLRNCPKLQKLILYTAFGKRNQNMPYFIKDMKTLRHVQNTSNKFRKEIKNNIDYQHIKIIE